MSESPGQCELVCEGQRKGTVCLAYRVSVASAGCEIEDRRIMVTSISQEVQGIFFSPDFFTYEEYIVSWKIILSDHLRNGFYPILLRWNE